MNHHNKFLLPDKSIWKALTREEREALNSRYTILCPIILFTEFARHGLSPCDPYLDLENMIVVHHWEEHYGELSHSPGLNSVRGLHKYVMCSCWHQENMSQWQRLYDRTGDIFMVQEMLGHRNVSTTQRYLGVNYASVRHAVEEMSLRGDLHRIHLLGMSLKKEADETLFLELALRGYDLSKLRDEETTAEIIKIG